MQRNQKKTKMERKSEQDAIRQIENGQQVKGLIDLNESLDLTGMDDVSLMDSETSGRNKEKTEGDSVSLQVRGGFGVSGNIRDTVCFVNEQEVLHPIGLKLCTINMETKDASFFEKSVKITSMALAPSKSIFAVAEFFEKTNEGIITIFHVATQTVFRTLKVQDCGSEIISMAFSKDSRYLVTQAGAPTFDLIYWKWEAEKIICRTKSPMLTTRVRFHPSDNSVITASGPGFLRQWKLSSSYTMKAQGIIPSKQESADNFTDHIWLNKKSMVTLSDSGTVRIFKTDDSSTSGAAAGKAPKLNLYQTLKTEFRDKNEYVRLETLACHNKGFIVAGSSGYIGIYEMIHSEDEKVMLIKSFHSSNKEQITSLTVSPSNEAVICYTKCDKLLSFPIGNIDMLFENQNPFTPFPFPQHKGPIKAMDICNGPMPTMVTAGTDKMVRIINYETMQCELEHHLPASYGDPNCLAIHPGGSLLVIGFKEHIRIYDVLLGELREKGNIFLKHCNCVQFTHGGQYLACSTNIMVNLYGTYTAKLVHSFTEHIGQVKNFTFCPNDAAVYSVGTDGAVYGRKLDTKQTIDSVCQSFETCQLTCVATNQAGDRIVVFGSDGLLREIFDGKETASFAADTRSLEEREWESALLNEASQADFLQEGSTDSRGSKKKKKKGRESMALGSKASAREEIITCLHVASNDTALFAGTSFGNIRVYQWPLSKFNGDFKSYPIHKAAISHIKVSYTGKSLFSSSSDGTCLVHEIQVPAKMLKAIQNAHHGTASILNNQTSLWASDADSVLVSHRDWNQRHKDVEDAKKELGDLKSAHEYSMHSKDNEWMETVRNVRTESSKALQYERQRYEELQGRHEKFVQKHIEEKQKMEADRVRISQSLENEYEKRLWEALRRADEKSEAIEALRQKTDEIIIKQEHSHMEELRVLKSQLEESKTKYTKEIDSLRSELNLERTKNEEIHVQQEREYELEILKLKGSAEGAVERERQVSALKQGQLVQQRNKYDRLRNKMASMKASKQEDDDKIRKLEQQVETLQVTLKRYEESLEEREIAFREKEKTILNLRSNNKTLDNFRYVLDYRIQKLMEEKGPIQDHISKLEAHIKEMYSELVAEFQRKKTVETQMTHKDMKVDSLSNEVSKLRVRLREKDRQVSSLSHTITTAAKLGDSKQAMNYLTDAYRKQILKENPSRKRASNTPSGSNSGTGGVKGEDSVILPKVGASGSNSSSSTNSTQNGGNNHSDDSTSTNVQSKQQVDLLLDDNDGYSPEETLRQREYMQRTLEAMQKSLRAAERKLQEKSKRAVQENALLIQECNRLRKEAVYYRQKSDEKESKMVEMSRKLKRASLGNSSSSPCLETSSSEYERSSSIPTTPTRSRGSNGCSSSHISNNQMSELQTELVPVESQRPSTSNYPQRSKRVEDSSPSSRRDLRNGSKSPSNMKLGVSIRPNTAGNNELKSSATTPPWILKRKKRQESQAQQQMVEKLLHSLDEANREILMQRSEIRKLRMEAARVETSHVATSLSSDLSQRSLFD